MWWCKISLLDWASRLGAWISPCNGFVLEVGVRRREAALTRDLRWADRPSPSFSSFKYARLVSRPLTGQYWCKTCHNYLPPCLRLLGILITEVSGIPQSEVTGSQPMSHLTLPASTCHCCPAWLEHQALKIELFNRLNYLFKREGGKKLVWLIQVSASKNRPKKNNWFLNFDTVQPKFG